MIILHDPYTMFLRCVQRADAAVFRKEPVAAGREWDKARRWLKLMGLRTEAYWAGEYGLSLEQMEHIWPGYIAETRALLDMVAAKVWQVAA
jgi:hypothetical protein